jgi:hypothetical protein
LVYALVKIDKLEEGVFKAAAIIPVKSRTIEVKIPLRVNVSPVTFPEPANLKTIKKTSPMRLRWHL